MPQESERDKRRRRLLLLAQSRGLPQNEAEGSTLGSIARTTGEPFNRGLASTLQFPTDVLNAGIRGAGALGEKAIQAMPGQEQFESGPAPQIPADVEGGFRQAGLTLPPEERAEGVIPRAFEIAGASSVPLLGLGQRGSQVLKTLPGQAQFRAPPPALTNAPKPISAGQNIAATIAQSPKATAAIEGVASTTAATGGEVAKGFTDSDTIIALAEIAGGFSPMLLAVAPVVRAAGAAKDAITKNLLPFTKGGAEARAAARLQSLAADPEAAAAKIGTAPELSPARQTGDKRLIALENKMREFDSKLDARFSDDLKQGVQQIKDSASFGGDPDRPRELLEIVARQAAERAQIEIAKLGPDASPRQISRIARESIDEALTAARTTERRLWESLDQTAPADLANARRALADEIANRVPEDDPADIPAWLRNQLAEDEIPQEIQALGPAAREQALAAVEPRDIRFRNVQALRKRTLRAIRDEKALDSPNRNKVRILSDVEEALLEDLTVTGVEGVTEARTFSNALNEKFTRGKIGQLLGSERRGGQSVAPEDTLKNIVFSKNAATNTQRFIETNSEAPEQVLNFIRRSYLDTFGRSEFIEPKVHDRFVGNLRRNGIFEVFPELEAELNAARNASRESFRLNIQDENPIAQRTGKSKASVFLGAPVGAEMDAVLTATNPASAARSVVAKMGGDTDALQGLKTSFLESIWKRSVSGLNDAGEDVFSGKLFTRQLKDNADVMRALGINTQERQRLSVIAEKLRKADIDPGTKGVKRVIEDKASVLMDSIARIAAVKQSKRFSGDIGGRLVIAGIFSRRAQAILEKLTTSTSRDLLLAASEDPKLYKSLLIRPTDPPRKQELAASTIDAWLTGVVVTQEGEN